METTEVKKFIALDNQTALMYGINTYRAWLKERSYTLGTNVCGDFLRNFSCYGKLNPVADDVFTVNLYIKALDAGIQIDLPEDENDVLIKEHTCHVAQAKRIGKIIAFLKENTDDQNLLKQIDGYLTLQLNRILKHSTLTTYRVDSLFDDLDEVIEIISMKEPEEGFEPKAQWSKKAFSYAIDKLYTALYITLYHARDFESDFVDMKDNESKYWVPVLNVECVGIITDPIYFTSFMSNVEITQEDIVHPVLEELYHTLLIFKKTSVCTVVIDDPMAPQKEWTIYRTFNGTYCIVPALTY